MSKIDRKQICEDLTAYVIAEFLEGEAEDLDTKTPLLESGIINSMSILMLASFVKDRYGAVIPPEDFTPSNFQNIDALAQLVERHAPA